MHFTQSQLLEYLQHHHIPYTLYTHEPLFTCEQAAEVVERMQIPGICVKNLFLKDSKGKLYLIIAAYHSTVKLKETGKALQAKELRFANAELLLKHLGVTPGSVTPLALINDKELAVQAIIDSTIFTHDSLQAHPLNNDATVVLSVADLIRFFQSHGRTYITYDFGYNVPTTTCV